MHSTVADTTVDASVFDSTLASLEANPAVREMMHFRQHMHTNTFAHCCHVAKESYRLAKLFRWDIDEKSLAVGAMLHDYYLYDIQARRLSAYAHGTRHPAVSLQNASEIYELNPLEKEIILCHMWPLNLRRVPRSREAILICLADKICATQEFMPTRKNRQNRLPEHGLS